MSELALLQEPDSLGGPPQSRISIWQIANVLLRYRWLLVGLALSFSAFVVVKGLLADRTYSASTTFMPVARGASSVVSGLAAQFGLGAQADVTQSPQFYMDLIRTRAILKNVVAARYTIKDGRLVKDGDLVTFLDVGQGSPVERLNGAIEKLAGQIRVSSTPKTGVITLTVKAPHPDLAVAVANRILEEINTFNRIRRQSQARAERTFTEQRLSEVKSDLRLAEDQLQQFLQSNREYRSSPQLTFEYDRLARQVGMRQQMYTGLAQAYEQAKVDEIRDNPVLTVIESAERPLKPDPRGLRSSAITALFFGALIGAMIGFAREYFRGQKRTQADDFAEFMGLRSRFMRELTFPLRLIRSPGRS